MRAQNQKGDIHMRSCARFKKNALATTDTRMYASEKTIIAAVKNANGPENRAQKATWGRYVKKNRAPVIPTEVAIALLITGVTAL